MRGDNTQERKVASTGDRTQNHQVISLTRSPQSHPGGQRKKRTTCHIKNVAAIFLLFKLWHSGQIAASLISDIDLNCPHMIPNEPIALLNVALYNSEQKLAVLSALVQLFNSYISELYIYSISCIYFLFPLNCLSVFCLYACLHQQNGWMLG